MSELLFYNKEFEDFLNETLVHEIDMEEDYSDGNPLAIDVLVDQIIILALDMDMLTLEEVNELTKGVQRLKRKKRIVKQLFEREFKIWLKRKFQKKLSFKNPETDREKELNSLMDQFKDLTISAENNDELLDGLTKSFSNFMKLE